MLNINTLFVLEEGTLIGFINKIEFIKKRKANTDTVKTNKAEVLNKDLLIGKGYEDFLKFFKR
jgi:GTP cyclohydrolase II